MIARKLVGQHDMMLSTPLGEQRWTTTRVIQKNDRSVRAVYLEPCEVTDFRRFGYLNGQWYRLEQTEFETQQPRRQTFKDELGSYTLVECEATDPDKLFFTDGTHWKQER